MAALVVTTGVAVMGCGASGSNKLVSGKPGSGSLSSGTLSSGAFGKTSNPSSAKGAADKTVSAGSDDR